MSTPINNNNNAAAKACPKCDSNASVPLFKDFGKKGKDALTKNYPSNKKLTVKTATVSGVSTEVTFEKDKDGNFPSNLKVKYSCPRTKMDFTETFCSRNLLFVEVSRSRKFTSGSLKVGGKVGVDSSVSSNVEFKADKFTLTADATFAKVLASVSAGSSCCAVGTEVEIPTATFQPQKITAKLNYANAKTEGTLYIAKANDIKLGATAYYVVDDATAIAAEAIYDTKGSVSVTAGTVYKMDANTTLQGKINSNGVANVSITQSLNPRLKATAAMEVNAATRSGSKLGLEFAFDL